MNRKIKAEYYQVFDQDMVHDTHTMGCDFDDLTTDEAEEKYTVGFFFSYTGVIQASKDGVLDGGEFAHIYFVDWDHVRARRRQLNVTVMGTTEDLQEDRKWNDGKVIDTLHKFTPEEKADDIHYTLQQKR